MFKFEEKLAVIATVNAKTAQGEPFISADDVIRLSSDLERETGYAILNAFFANEPDYFKYAGKSPDGNPVYGIRTDKHGDVVRAMIARLDPPINYPIDFLRAAGLLEKLAPEPYGPDCTPICAKCQYRGDKYSFPLPNDLLEAYPDDPSRKPLYCCCGDSGKYMKDVTKPPVHECGCFEEL